MRACGEPDGISFFKGGQIYPEIALDILGTGVEREERRIAKMLDSSFNEDAGFRSTKHCISKDEVCFDINQCPYCKYLTEIGCPEIIRFSCEIDQWIYGDLPGLKFERAGTLGTGADKCDFCLKRVKQ